MLEIFPTNKTAVCALNQRLVASQKHWYRTVTHLPSPHLHTFQQTRPQHTAKNHSPLCRETCLGNASEGYSYIKIPVSACSNQSRRRMFSSQAAGLTCRYASWKMLPPRSRLILNTQEGSNTTTLSGLTTSKPWIFQCVLYFFQHLVLISAAQSKLTKLRYTSRGYVQLCCVKQKSFFRSWIRALHWNGPKTV